LLRHSTVPAGDLEFFYAFEPEHGTVVTTAKTTVPFRRGELQLLRRNRTVECCFCPANKFETAQRERVRSAEKFIFKKYNIAKFYGVIQTPITKKPKK